MQSKKALPFLPFEKCSKMTKNAVSGLDTNIDFVIKYLCMGARTKIINKIRQNKKDILLAYARLVKKNDSSFFDAFAKSYGAQSIQNVISSLGFKEFGIQKAEKQTSEKLALAFAKKAFGKNYAVANLYSPCCFVEDGFSDLHQVEKVGKQQVCLCLVNKDKIDIKHKFEHDKLLQNLQSGDVVLLDISIRKISLSQTQKLNVVGKKNVIANAQMLQKYILPNLKVVDRKRYAKNMSVIKQNSPKLYSQYVQLDKKILQKLFVFETAKEQLALNDAIEEFSKIYDCDKEQIRQNFELVLKDKQKADSIQQEMQKNDQILHFDF